MFSLSTWQEQVAENVLAKTNTNKADQQHLLSHFLQMPAKRKLKNVRVFQERHGKFSLCRNTENLEA